MTPHHSHLGHPSGPWDRVTEGQAAAGSARSMPYLSAQPGRRLRGIDRNPLRA